MEHDDAIVLAYLAGVLTVAVGVPVAFVASIRYVPPVRRAFRAWIEDTTDREVSGLMVANLPHEIVGLADATLRVSQRVTLAQFVHREVSVRAASAVLEFLGAPTTG